MTADPSLDDADCARRIRDRFDNEGWFKDEDYWDQLPHEVSGRPVRGPQVVDSLP